MYPANPKILIAEDDALTADHLCRTLTSFGYEVVAVTADGTQALDLITRMRPDLLLVNIALSGGINGIELANHARDLWKTPTVFLAAYSDPAIMQRAKMTEPYGFLIKPFADQELHATIEIALRQKNLAAMRERQVQVATQILGRTQKDLDAVASRLFTAEDRERQRIARDLHDDIGQRLALLQIDIERLWRRLPESAQIATELERNVAIERIGEILTDLRRLSHSLHPQILDDLGLETALGQLCESFEARHSIQVRLTAHDVPLNIPPQVAITLYRIVQEGLQNIAKHSEAKSVDITLFGVISAIELSIRDNGKGFDPTAPRRGPGLGLLSMAERSKLAGGDFEIHSRRNGGTQIQVRIPLDQTVQKFAAARAQALF